MADIGNTYHEYDGRKGSGSHDAVYRPRKSTTRISDTDESDGDAAFDNNGSGSVEKLSDEEELSAIVVSFALQVVDEGAYLSSTHDVALRQGSSKLPRAEKTTGNT